MAPRYAVYLAPSPDSALWEFGSRVVGYDAVTGEDLAPLDLAGFDAPSWRDLTAEPRLYGFHGTLKPPFRLADGVSEADAIAAFTALAAQHHAFELPPLEVKGIGTFIALLPSAPTPVLNDLAGELVAQLDHLRAPLTAAEMAKRNPDRLSERQVRLLEHYGYPYVMEEFRFHMTLSGPLEVDAAVHVQNTLADAFAASGAHLPLMVEDLALFRQEAPGVRFRQLARAPLRPL